LLPGLKRHRVLAGLTQEELAERAGVHRVSVVEIERGKRPARPRTLKKLADALGVSTRDLAED
jgi:transcriptional regulator with XRE-family HTH domain